MGVITESLCFCKGVSKSERLKATIFSGKSPAMATIFSNNGNGNGNAGTGFLIHRNLLLTTHGTVPSISVAECCEIHLHNGVGATLFPHRFFITSSVLDLTIVGLDVIDGDPHAQSQLPCYLKSCTKPNLNLGSAVFLLGHTDNNELTIGEGKVVIATDNLIKLSTDGISWSPGSAGFDSQGNVAFMICDPMKMATSPNPTTSLSSSPSSKKELPMQFGIPIPVICDWLNQHWEGSLDDLNKPKLPIIRLMSAGQKSEQSCASFTMRRVFKATDTDNDGTPSSSSRIARTWEPPGRSGYMASNVINEETGTNDPQITHIQGIPTPEIYESRKVTSLPVRRKENTQIQLLDINFPPRLPKPTVLLEPKNEPQLVPKNCQEEFPIQSPPRGEAQIKDTALVGNGEAAEMSSTGSVNGAQSEVQSCASPVEASELHHHGYISEEETMYSAETAESRNYTGPREEKLQQVGRSQSCVNYNRWGSVQRDSTARRTLLERERSFIHGRKVHSHGATSQRSNDYYSPTVSSIMKKRNSLEQPNRPRPSAVHSSPRWVF